MRTERSPSIKQKIRRERKSEQRIGLIIGVAILVATIFISGFIINSMLNQPSTSQTVGSTSQHKAAIVDQLSLTLPNQTFIERATDILEQAGYNVDYYPGEKVTVEFYRDLATHGYKILILRVHSVADVFQGRQMVGLFTSELYSPTRYIDEQLTDQVGCLGYYPGAQTRYFGISQEFLKSSMKGRFDNAVVIMMGCEGLNNTAMAEAFMVKGAHVYIAWNSSPSTSYNDLAITHLLQHFLIEKQTVKKAVENTMKTVGNDHSNQELSLCYYPIETAEQTIENIQENLR